MAQVYRFTDANGEVRLMAEIDPAPAVAATTTTVTAAQLKALVATGVQLVAAPGAGKALVPLGLFVQVKFGTTAFVDPGTADIGIMAGTDPNNSVIVYEFLTQGLAPPSPGIDVFTQPTDSYWYTGGPDVNSLIAASTPLDNAPLTLRNFTANLTTGDGSARFVVYYATVTLV